MLLCNKLSRAWGLLPDGEPAGAVDMVTCTLASSHLSFILPGLGLQN